MRATLTNVDVHWPTLDEVWRTLSLQAGYNSAIVVVGAGLLGLAGGLVGAFAMLRRRALMGDALSHAALPGIALAFMLGVWITGSGRSLPLLLAGAAVSGIAGVLSVQAIVRFTRVREDAAIGIVLSVFFGAGTVLLSIIQSMQTGQEGGLKTFIYGQTAAMSMRDAFVIGGIAAVAGVATILLFKEFRLVCFDESFARVQGWPVGPLDLAMMALVVIVLVIGLQAVGLLLVVAMLIIPPAAARMWTDRFSRLVIASAAVGLSSGWLGSSVSTLVPRMPAGAIIVLTSASMFLLSLLGAPRRGVIAASIVRVSSRLRVRQDHLLRLLFEREERGAGGLTLAIAAKQLGWRRLTAVAAFQGARRAKLIGRAGEAFSLTGSGRTVAARLTRNHRLWEQYLISYADIAPSHVDWSADMVEHSLDADLVHDLELALTDRGIAIPRGVPASTHDLEAAPGNAA